MKAPDRAVKLYWLPMHDDGDILIRILSQPRYLCVVRAAVEAATQRFGLSEAEAGRVVMAVNEAVTNTMRHGYQGRMDGPIWVTLSPVSDNGRSGVLVRIEDETEAVDVQQIRSRPLDEIRPGGLGVHIIQQAMDEVTYEPRPGCKGLCLTMRKYAHAQPTPSSKQG